MNLIRACICFLAISAGAAHGFTISGTVTGSQGGAAIAGATVTVFIANSATQMGQQLTNGAGGYSITGVPADTYDLQVVPPAGPYTTALIQDIVVNGDVVQNVVLTPPLRTLSGQVRTPGANLSGVDVSLRNCSNVTSPLAITTTTGTGNYSLQIPDGDYCVWIDALGNSSVGSMPSYIEWHGQSPITVAGNTAKDFDIPLALVQGKTKNGPTPLNNVDVTIAPSFGAWLEPVTGTEYWWYLWNDPGRTVSAGAGDYALRLMPSTYEVTIIPPTGAGVAPTQVSLPVTLSVFNADLDFSPVRTFSGTLRGHANEVLPGATISLHSCENFSSPLASGTTDGSGQFTMDIGHGNFCPKLSVNGGFTAAMPTLLELSTQATVAIAADTVKNWTLPIARLTGKTTTSTGAAVANVAVNVPPIIEGTWTESATGHFYVYFTLSNSGVAVSNGNGDYVAKLMPGDYGLLLVPPSNSPYAPTPITRTVFFDETANLALAPLRTLSGTLRGHANEALTNVTVSARNCLNATTPLASAVTNGSGQYSLEVGDGPYCIWLATNGGPAGMPTTIEWRGQVAVVVSGDTTKNYDLPLKRLAGRAVDANGAGVANVNVTIPPFATGVYNEPVTGHAYAWFAVNEAGRTVSDSQGDFLLKLMPSSYNLDFIAPPASGFTNITVAYPLSADGATSFNLPFPDIVAPAILSGPVAREITSDSALIEWLTDEPTSGSVSVNAQAFVEAGPARTRHSVRVNGLDPATPYNFTVSSNDAAANGPVTRPGSFTTGNAADVRAPAYIDGPVATSITDQAAVIEWATDEAAGGLVSFGLTPALGGNVNDPVAAARHRVALTGLQASTTYYVRVATTDTAGNGPTQSATFDFRTLAASDAKPPNIIGKPQAIDVTASGATIAWRTDEPATSGVSWNNGTSYGLVTDGAFTTDHTVRITGLAAGQAYSVTASSMDERGNGPTLSAITFSTLAAGDVTGPVITCGPETPNVRQRTAVVRWCTGEASDSRVAYGTSAASLTRQQSRAQLETVHQVMLTGLDPSTTYHFRVESRDAAGNVSPPGATLSLTTTGAAVNSLAFLQAPGLLHRGDRQVTVSWETDAPADAMLECTPQAGGETLRVSRATRETKHQLTVANLDPNVIYTCRARSIDLDGNVVEQ